MSEVVVQAQERRSWFHVISRPLSKLPRGQVAIRTPTGGLGKSHAEFSVRCPNRSNATVVGVAIVFSWEGAQIDNNERREVTLDPVGVGEGTVCFY